MKNARALRGRLRVSGGSRRARSGPTSTRNQRLAFADTPQNPAVTGSIPVSATIKSTTYPEKAGRARAPGKNPKSKPKSIVVPPEREP